MNPEDFTPAAPGRLVGIGPGLWAFAPDPLPPKLEWTSELVRALAEAERALGELAGLGRTLPNPYLFTRPFLRREAVLSSRIEGTQASLADLYAFEAQPALFALPEQRNDVLEVRNYVRALEHGLARLRELPLCLRLLREMHAILLEGARGQNRAPGEFRRVQNWIGGSGSIEDAIYVPPPPGEVLPALDALEKYLHGESPYPALVDIALVHYQFEAIHPFLDGNGRIGRLLITLMLIERGLLHEPLLYLSAYFERQREHYYRLLLEVSQKGAWEAWVRFFLEGVAKESRDVARRAGALLDLRERYRQTFQAESAGATLLAAVDHLFAQPVFDIRGLQKTLGVTFEAARRAVARLEAAGVLTEITGQRRSRVYAAKEVLEHLEAP